MHRHGDIFSRTSCEQAIIDHRHLAPVSQRPVYPFRRVPSRCRIETERSLYDRQPTRIWALTHIRRKRRDIDMRIVASDTSAREEIVAIVHILSTIASRQRQSDDSGKQSSIYVCKAVGHK